MRADNMTFFGSSRYEWFFRYKLYHLPFWFVYHYLWATIKTGDPVEVASYVFTSPSFKFLFYVIFQALGVYFNLYFLIPKYLEKSRYVEYMAGVALTILCTASIIVYGYHLGAFFTNNSLLQLYGTEKFSYFFMTYTFPSTVAAMTLAMSVKLTKNWIQSKQREQLLEKEKLETELKFLKSQFNPHFLFNTINSIFVLIHKNQNMASDALAKFSELLRYQLYECNEHEIPVGQELTYLENFAELEKLRHDVDDLALDIRVERPHTPDLTIAPFVLIPFIENAFKHVSQGKGQPNWIKMDLRFDRHQLHFSIVNSISAQGSTSRKVMEYGGIGLKNVQRRLDLIYPEEYRLTIEDEDEQFCATLCLSLHEHKVAVRSASTNVSPVSMPVE